MINTVIIVVTVIYCVALLVLVILMAKAFKEGEK